MARVDRLADTVNTTPDKGAAAGAKDRLPPKKNIKLAGPLSFWIIFLVVGVIAKLVITPLLAGIGMIPESLAVGALGQYILYFPGYIIFPFVVGIWIGERIGDSVTKPSASVTIGLINSAYAAVIYAVAIFTIFLIMTAVGGAASFNFSMLYSLIDILAFPIAILVGITIIFSSLAAARKTR